MFFACFSPLFGPDMLFFKAKRFNSAIGSAPELSTKIKGVTLLLSL